MNFLEQLRDAGLLAIVRGADPDAALAATLTLAEEGVRFAEISLTTAGALDVIAQARAALGPDAWIGAGTVLSAGDVESASAAGASFIVTPAFAPSVAAAVARGIPVLAGALTPTEVAGAQLAGATGVKLFPASLGGSPYLRALRDPFPGTAFVPVGGVDEDAARVYLAGGALAVGVGSPLIGDAVSGGRLSGLRDRTRRFLSAVAAAR